MNNGDLAAAAFGLAAAASWGAGSFSGGLSARRASVFSVAPFSRVTGLAAQISLALVVGERAPSPASLLWAAAAGVAGSAGLIALYASLAVEKMGHQFSAHRCACRERSGARCRGHTRPGGTNRRDHSRKRHGRCS